MECHKGFQCDTRWWQLKHFLFSPRSLGFHDSQFDLRIFFKWVGSTTNIHQLENGEVFFRDRKQNMPLRDHLTWLAGNFHPLMESMCIAY